MEEKAHSAKIVGILRLKMPIMATGQYLTNCLKAVKDFGAQILFLPCFLKK